MIGGLPAQRILIWRTTPAFQATSSANRGAADHRLNAALGSASCARQVHALQAPRKRLRRRVRPPSSSACSGSDEPLLDPSRCTGIERGVSSPSLLGTLPGNEQGANFVSFSSSKGSAGATRAAGTHKSQSRHTAVYHDRRAEFLSTAFHTGRHRCSWLETGKILTVRAHAHKVGQRRRNLQPGETRVNIRLAAITGSRTTASDLNLVRGVP